MCCLSIKLDFLVFIMSKNNYHKRNNRRKTRSKKKYHHKSSRNRGFKPSNINPQRYIAKAQKSSSCSIYDPNCKFTDFNLVNSLHQNIKKKGYKKPTKIQAQAIPCCLEGRDVLGLASTGSGKTAAFLIPMLNKAIKDKNQRCLIVTPTRELANQIQKEFIFFAKGSKARSALIIGGQNIRTQIGSLKQKPQFVVATPGRLIDLMNKRIINLGQFNNIVLDEVDRMLDMGFINDIKLITRNLRKQKQSLFFSATINKKVEEVARTFLHKPEKVQVEKLSPRKNVDQNVVRVNSHQKLDRLHDILIKDGFNKVLIFSRTRRGTDKLRKKLDTRGFSVDSVHGGKTQSRRQKVMKKFRTNQIDILVATDVAARGLDINNITHVINYDEPATYDDYIHRIGRTGRAGKKGNALTFVVS
jgi:superfamily II DNA/RNA helicase